MADLSNNCKKMNSLLVRESIWQIEDRMNVIIETLADLEAGLIRLRGTVTTLEQRLSRLEQNRTHRLAEEANHG